MNCIDKILTDEEIDNLVNEIMNIPIEKNNNCLSAYGNINTDELISVIKEMRKVPTYDELLKENKKSRREKQELIDYLKYQINECKSTGNDEDYIKLDVYEEILSKIEKE